MYYYITVCGELVIFASVEFNRLHVLVCKPFEFTIHVCTFYPSLNAQAILGPSLSIIENVLNQCKHKVEHLK